MIDSGATPMMIAGFFEQWAPAIVQDKGIVMQSTGLLDANGQEIFEGDVCEIGNDVQKISVFAEVEFLDDGFCLVELDGTIHSVADAIFRPGFDYPSGKQISPARIVGNIYANRDMFPKAA